MSESGKQALLCPFGCEVVVTIREGKGGIHCPSCMRAYSPSHLAHSAYLRGLQHNKEELARLQAEVVRLTALANKYAAPYIPEMRGEGACTCLPGCVSHIAGCPMWVLQY